MKITYTEPKCLFIEINYDDELANQMSNDIIKCDDEGNVIA